MSQKIYISGTGLFVPNQEITNEELVNAYNLYAASHNEQHATEIASGAREALQESTSAFIEKASGILSRRVIDKTGILDVTRLRPRIQARDENVMSLQCEMAYFAAEQALMRAGKKGSDIDMVILSATNTERAYPSIAIELQNQLGAKGYAYDMGVACSSATFGLSSAHDAIKCGRARCVLVVTPELCSFQLNFHSRDSNFIFGDAAVAAIIEADESVHAKHAYEILDIKCKTAYSNNIRSDKGCLDRCIDGLVESDDRLFRQNGRRVFKEVIPMAVNHITGHCRALGITPDKINRLWLHQANSNMNRLIAAKILGHEASALEMPITLDKYANTAGAGCLIAFHENHQDLPSGSLGILSSFGAGYSIGSLILRKR